MKNTAALIVACLMVSGCVTPAAPPGQGQWRASRTTTYDYSCLTENNTILKGFSTLDSALEYCSNLALKDGVTRYVSGGRYRIEATPGTTPPEPENECETPKPADETRTQQCPSGTTGTWTQTRTYTSAPYPTCWVAGEWQPTSAPSGACTTPPTAGSPPLSWNDARYATATSAGRQTLSSGQSRSNLSIEEQSGEPSILCNGSCTLSVIRVKSREGYRCVSGTQNLTDMYFETTGTGNDHADGLQCYSPGSSGALTVRNTTFKLAGAMNAGYFSADNWKGTHVLENVLFWGGGYGLRIPADGGSSVKLKNVYFVRGSFVYGAYLFDVVNGKQISIDQWDNVRWVTIENGQMIQGEQIPKP